MDMDGASVRTSFLAPENSAETDMLEEEATPRVEISFVFSNWFFNSRLFLSSAHSSRMASENAFLHFVDNASTEESAASDQEANGPPLTTLRRCVGVEPRGGGRRRAGIPHTRAHALGAEGARAQGHLSLCLCRASLALSPFLLPPPPPPSGVAPVIGFIHATMLLVPTHTKGPQNTFAHSLLASLHLAAPPEQDAERTRHWCIAAAIVGRDERRRPLPHVRV